METRPGETLPLASGLLLPRYMANAVWLQRVVEPDRVLVQNLHFPTLSHPVLPGPGSGHQPQPLALHKPVKAPPGSGEAEAVLEVSSVCWERGLCGLCRRWRGRPLTPAPAHVGLVLKPKHSELKEGGLQTRGVLEVESQPSRIHQGLWKHKDHTTLLLVSLGPVTYPFWTSVSSAIMRTETSPVVYNLGGGSESFI